MSKYEKKVVFDYVMGNDIDNYNIDDLENDFEFMMEVFEYTNDKKTYDLCDDKLKVNVDLIKYLINKYKDDINFILEISSNFLNNSDNNLDKIEIQIMLENAFGDDDDFYREKLYNKLNIQSFYMSERLEYELALKETDDDVRDFLQLGFYYFYEEYKDRKLITDFIAKKLVNEIFDFRNNDLEELIHSIYNEKSQIDKTTSIKFILDYISNHDYALANYLSVHVDIILDLKKSVDRIFRNFEYYNKNKYDELIDGIKNYIEDYSEENKYYDDMNLRKFIGRDLKNKDIWVNFDDSTFTVQLEDEFGFYEGEVEIDDIPCDEYGFYEIDFITYEKIKNDMLYIRLREDVKRMLNNNEVYDRYNNPYKKEMNNGKCRILKFEQKKEQ